MSLNPRFRALALIATGLIGMALYPIVTRTAHPLLLNGDAVHGVWVGVCVGLEIVGLWLLRSTRSGRAA